MPKLPLGGEFAQLIPYTAVTLRSPEWLTKRVSHEIKREMPHNFLQSLKTKDDNKFSVKVLLGRLSRFTMRINDSGLAYNEE